MAAQDKSVGGGPDRRLGYSQGHATATQARTDATATASERRLGGGIGAGPGDYVGEPGQDFLSGPGIQDRRLGAGVGSKPRRWLCTDTSAAAQNRSFDASPGGGSGQTPLIRLRTDSTAAA